MIDKEVWCPIPGHVGYEASNLGRARSVTRQLTNCLGVTKTLQGRLLHPILDKQTGYFRVSLGRAVRPTPVHVWVLTAFVGKCPEGQEGLHENNDKSNNGVLNLSWGTQSNNALDRVRHGVHHGATKTVCLCAHTLFPPNLRKRKDTYRECLACYQAHGFINKRGLTKSKIGKIAFKAIADRYYYQIMEAV